jgi:internalin A
LSVSDCGTIDTIAPLANLHNLEWLSAWGSTRILDGDMQPLAQLPRLAEIRMRDRATYHPRISTLKAKAK